MAANVSLESCLSLQQYPQIYSTNMLTHIHVCEIIYSSEARRSRNQQVRKAFDLIASANTATILSLDEMESIVNRALSGEFDTTPSTGKQPS